MRAAVTLGIGFCLLILQSTLLKVVPVHLAVPNLGLLVTLYAGLASWPLGVAAVVGLVSGYLLDLVSGSPQGVHAFVFIVMALLARVLASRVAVRGMVLAFAVAFVGTFVAGLLTVLVRAQVAPQGGYGGLGEAPMQALFTGLLGPPVLGMLRRIDGRMDPARSRVGVARGPRRLGAGVLR